MSHNAQGSLHNEELHPLLPWRNTDSSQKYLLCSVTIRNWPKITQQIYLIGNPVRGPRSSHSGGFQCRLCPMSTSSYQVCNTKREPETNVSHRKADFPALPCNTVGQPFIPRVWSIPRVVASTMPSVTSPLAEVPLCSDHAELRAPCPRSAVYFHASTLCL